ncbi:hypothetical protein BD777DRAFT_125180 [Yarrowia lipolytica]|jgi:hypothetical protein|nr:hypothetical protein BD777DRAFT_125180 [Yarrowia lipolytica]
MVSVHISPREGPQFVAKEESPVVPHRYKHVQSPSAGARNGHFSRPFAVYMKGNLAYALVTRDFISDIEGKCLG